MLWVLKKVCVHLRCLATQDDFQKPNPNNQICSIKPARCQQLLTCRCNSLFIAQSPRICCLVERISEFVFSSDNASLPQLFRNCNDCECYHLKGILDERKANSVAAINLMSHNCLAFKLYYIKSNKKHH